MSVETKMAAGLFAVGVAVVAYTAVASPFVVTDPVDIRATHCGWSLDAEARKDIPVVTEAGVKICKLDVASSATGKHTVTATISYVDATAGRQESPASVPFAFGDEVVVPPPPPPAPAPLVAPKGLKLSAVVTPPPPPPPPPTDASAPPLSWDDARFVDMRTSGPLKLGSGGAAKNLSFDDQSGNPTIECSGCTIETVRMRTREGPRCVSGAMNMSNMWVDTKGQGDDHADGLQCYSPNSSGTVTVKSSTFKGDGSVHTGYFSADNWKGAHVFENVLFWGGNFGLRLNVDGGSSASLKNVYFVKDSFGITPAQVDIPIKLWENVRWVTIVGGKMVVGDAIPKP